VLLAPHLDVLTAHDEPGSALSAWAAHHTFTGTGPEPQTIYLAGHAQTVQRLRTQLRLDGIPRHSIVTKAYWATGRAGLSA